MMKTYKVWIEIEETDEENDTCKNVCEPVSIGGEFETIEEASAFAATLEDIA